MLLLLILLPTRLGRTRVPLLPEARPLDVGTMAAAGMDMPDINDEEEEEEEEERAFISTPLKGAAAAVGCGAMCWAQNRALDLLKTLLQA